MPVIVMTRLRLRDPALLDVEAADRLGVAVAGAAVPPPLRDRRGPSHADVRAGAHGTGEANLGSSGEPGVARRRDEDMAAASCCGCHGRHCYQASSDCRISAAGRRAAIRAGIAVSPAITSRVTSATASNCQAGGMGRGCPLLTAASIPMASGMPRMAPGNAGSNCAADSPVVTCCGVAPSARDGAEQRARRGSAQDRHRVGSGGNRAGRPGPGRRSRRPPAGPARSGRPGPRAAAGARAGRTPRPVGRYPG